MFGSESAPSKSKKELKAEAQAAQELIDLDAKVHKKMTIHKVVKGKRKQATLQPTTAASAKAAASSGASIAVTAASVF